MRVGDWKGIVVVSKKLIVAGIAAAALIAAGSALAITNGQRDGNGHPNVGAMMAFDDPSAPNTLQVLCTGTLVAPQVFLTASHCTDYLLNELHITDVWVTFSTNSAEGPYIHGTMVQNPAYNGKPAQNGNDIAVILLDSAPHGITPAPLPPVGLFDAMKAKKTLTQSSAFTAVGYGDGDRVHTSGGGQPTFNFDGYRRVATSFFNSLSRSWLRLTQNASVGAGGTCFGDSGGPDFLGSSRMLAGITITGDSACSATNVDLRLDTQSAQDFLAQFGVPRG
jgi:secreted trypsin-like serine protease